ncbi:MAG: hypothetical protein CME05_09475 [Gemmatimonadaceae bacterium]|nr:hypothetical protein [Gemmatimonadaceae bacterium]|tara:strand:- start:1702 stop:1974 length:273 start_codon:yes stop_codon:yes gene_type:complete
MVSRRQFLAASAGLMLTGIPSRGADNRKRVAFLGTEIRQHSHAQHFLDRITAGQAWGGHWLEPSSRGASICIDQFPQGDLTPGRVERHGL